MSQTRVYFTGLNGLRFLAAFSVIFTHIELIRHHLGFHHNWVELWGIHHSGPLAGQRVVDRFPLEEIFEGTVSWIGPLAAEAGPLGVIFFFVLSGFLITYLLFAERQNTGRISARHFYLRRILRIWPLYYIIFILGFFILPDLEWWQVGRQSAQFAEHFWGNFWGYVFIFPNLAASIYEDVPNIGQSWSIGVEEQFYLIWPLLIKWSKKPLRMIVGFGFAYVGLKAVVLLVSKVYSPEWMMILSKFLAMSKIECMTIGAFGAWLLFYNREKVLKFLYQKWVQLITIFGIPALVYLTPAPLQDGIHLVFACLFATLILNVSSNKNSIINLENKPFHFLGKISYGIYMYHMLVIVAVLNIGKSVLNWPPQMTTMQIIGLYISVVILTLLISWLSYTFVESKFIKMKGRFSKVISGDEARK